MTQKKIKSASQKLSVIMPVYNEKPTIETIIQAVRNSPVKNLELIVVDDNSTDGTREILKNKLKPHIDHLVLKPKNQGKGSAIRVGLQKVTGDIVIIQDADLEYDPNEYLNVIGPILEGKADVVYGSRFAGHQPHRVVYFWHYVANRTLTLFSNALTNINLTDMETGYKAVRTDLLKQISLEENSFGIEPEITVKLAALKPRFYEVGISYHGRQYEEGKKIGPKDAIWAIWALVKYTIQVRLSPPQS